MWLFLGTSFEGWIQTQSRIGTSPSSTVDTNYLTYQLSGSIEATNEFPMLGTFDMGSDPSFIETLNSTLVGPNESFQSDVSFDILRSFVHLFVYIQGKKKYCVFVLILMEL